MSTKLERIFLYAFLLASGASSAASGLLLQIVFHMGAASASVSRAPLGLSYNSWSGVHKVASLFFVGAILLHLILKRRWIRRVVAKRMMGRHKLTVALTILFVLSTLTGSIAWGVSGFAGHADTRRLFVEIHDKLTLFLTVFSVLHVWKRRRLFS